MAREWTQQRVANTIAEQYYIAKQLLVTTTNGNSAEIIINLSCSTEKVLHLSKISSIKIGISKASILPLKPIRKNTLKLNMIVNQFDQINDIYSI